MTPSEREEIEKVALKIRCKLIEEYGDECMIGQGYQAGVDLEVLIAKAMLTQVEKARLEGIALGIGWAHTNSCLILDNGGDPRKVDIPTQLEKAFDDLERNKLNQKGE